MSDSSMLIDNTIGVSSDVMYNLKASSVRGRSYRASIPTSNKSQFTMSGGEIAILKVPCGRRNTYLDQSSSYLKATIQNNDPSGNSFYFDTHGSCIINRADVFHASNVLSTLTQYNVLLNYITDFQIDLSQKVGLSTNFAFNNSNGRQGLLVAPTQAYTVSLPLLNGVIGLGSEKMIPIGKLIDDIEIDLTIEAYTSAFAWTSISGTTGPGSNPVLISNMELELQIIELSDEGENMVNSILNPEKPIYIHANDWRHYSGLMTSGSTGNFSFLIGMRFASAKGIVVCPRRSTEISSQLAYSLGSRANPQIQSYYFRVGSYIIPQRQVYIQNAQNARGYAEAFSEILKAFHSLSLPQSIAGVPNAYYNVADIADATVGGNGTSGVSAIYTGLASYANAFAIAQELETFSNRSDVIISGINCLSSQTFFEGSFSSTGPASNYTLDFYVNHDVIYEIVNGVMSARF